MSCMLLYYSSIPLLTPDCHFTDQTLLSLLCTGPAHLCVRSLSQQQSSHIGKSSWGPEMQTPKVTKWGEEPNPGSRGFGPVCALKGITGWEDTVPPAPCWGWYSWITKGWAQCDHRLMHQHVWVSTAHHPCPCQGGWKQRILNIPSNPSYSVVKRIMWWLSIIPCWPNFSKGPRWRQTLGSLQQTPCLELKKVKAGALVWSQLWEELQTQPLCPLGSWAQQSGQRITVLSPWNIWINHKIKVRDKFLK